MKFNIDNFYKSLLKDFLNNLMNCFTNKPSKNNENNSRLLIII